MNIGQFRLHPSGLLFRKSYILLLDFDADELSFLHYRGGGGRAAAHEAVEHDFARLGEQTDQPARQLDGELGLVVVVGADGREAPDAARTPVPPFFGREP